MTADAKPGRIRCSVPFCTRTTASDPEWRWTCWRHWKAIPLKRRRAYQRAVMETAPEWWPDFKPTRFTAPRHRRASVAPRSSQALYRLGDRMRADAARRAL